MDALIIAIGLIISITGIASAIAVIVVMYLNWKYKRKRNRVIMNKLRIQYEKQKAMLADDLTKYIKDKHNQDECIGFSDGYEAALTNCEECGDDIGIMGKRDDIISIYNEVYRAIDTERQYQDVKRGEADSHVVEDFPLAAGLEAIRYNLEKANEAWYTGKAPYPEAMEYMRKVAAISVQMGEKYGMPNRHYPAPKSE